ncbi:B-cell receptor CD22 [Labeo rohita]|uniref:B-cell receptor CD22 n=1 Tax=Labeo rohita TaxID=84645 RepID=A0ABQ8L3D9_LABRO|nr:B-cell receptor CD22 [Labeo rohita]
MNNHTDNYYFRVEMMPVNWKYTYLYRPINISVSRKCTKDSHPYTHSFATSDRENYTVLLKPPCPKQPSTISWSNVSKSANITTWIQQKPDKTQSVFSHVIFKALHIDHRKNISCTATYPRNISNDSTSLQKKLTSPLIRLIWSLLALIRSGGCYFCTAKNIHGSQMSEEIQLIVADDPTLFPVDIPEPPILTPTDLQESIYAALLKPLALNNLLQYPGLTSLNLPTLQHNYISCTATYPRNISNDSTVETTVTLRVLCKNWISPKDTHITIDPSNSVSVGTNVTLTCKSKASPNEMNYIWYKHGQEKVLDFGKQLTFNVNSGTTNVHGNQKSEEIQLIVAESLIITESLIIGCVIGISAFLLIILLVTHFLRLQKVKASTIIETDISDQGQEKQINSIYVNSAFLMDEELEMPKDKNDIIHYGEIDFSKTKSTTEKISGQETIYAEVCASGKD